MKFEKLQIKYKKLIKKIKNNPDLFGTVFIFFKKTKIL